MATAAIKAAISGYRVHTPAYRVTADNQLQQEYDIQIIGENAPTLFIFSSADLHVLYDQVQCTGGKGKIGPSKLGPEN